MNAIGPDFTRRRFIMNTAIAGTALFFKPFTSWASLEINPEIAKIVSEFISIDTHNHMDMPFNKENFNTQNYDLAVELKKSGLSAICMTFCVDRPNLTKEGEAFDRFILTLDEMDAMLEANNLSRALNFSDLKDAHKQNKSIVIQSVEGGHFIEGKLERIEVGYNRGLRHLGLLHDNQSAFPLGDIYTNPSKFGGLTELGKNVVKECNRLGILVDLAHCSNDAINDAIEVSTKPILVSHTGLNTQLGSNERMAKMMMPRLINKEQAKIIANAGGAIGVWTHLADSPLEFAQNIRAMVDVVGVDHVCIGTDTKIAPPKNENNRFSTGTNKMWESKEGFFYTVVDALLHTGFSKAEITKIGGNNYCRIFEKATTV